ncbi:N4-gp56 family major capsid protein [Desulfitispora alkaliphila]|uniref:N4-gp56 family major capsid protein n=1 Tax=Desulfitispora alkaliphila TaxID=622674 RepID=UPI003D23AFA4
MTKTMLSDLINPEVMADMVSAELPNKIRFTQIARVDNTLQGQAGNTITVPKYLYIGDAEDVAEGVAMGTTTLTTTSQQATVKKAGKAIELTDEAVLSGYGDPVGEAVTQLTMAMANKVDNDCLAALDEATLTHDASADSISADIIADAIDKFEEEDDEPKVLFIHSKQKTTLRKDPQFTRASDMGDAVVMSGVIGEIYGCQVVVSNKLPEDTDVYSNYIVKSGALDIYLKRNVSIEDDRDILAKTTVISADEHYVAVLADESKVVKFTCKA